MAYIKTPAIARVLKSITITGFLRRYLLVVSDPIACLCPRDSPAATIATSIANTGGCCAACVFITFNAQHIYRNFLLAAANVVGVPAFNSISRSAGRIDREHMGAGEPLFPSVIPAVAGSTAGGPARSGIAGNPGKG